MSGPKQTVATTDFHARFQTKSEVTTQIFWNLSTRDRKRIPCLHADPSELTHVPRQTAQAMTHGGGSDHEFGN